MITLTENAKAAVVAMLDRFEESIALLTINGKGCGGNSYQMGAIDEADIEAIDHVVELDGGKKLVVEGRAIPYLIGLVVDFVDGETQSGFTFENPNAVGTCGCGSSFKTEADVDEHGSCS